MTALLAVLHDLLTVLAVAAAVTTTLGAWAVWVTHNHKGN